MAITGWILLMSSAVLGGAVLVAALVVPRSQQYLPIAGAVVTFFGALAGFLDLVAKYGRIDVILAAFFLGLGAFIGGYGLAASLLPAIATRQPRGVEPAAAVRVPRDAPDIVLLADMEPSTYDPVFTMIEFSEASAAGAPQTPVFVVPFVFAAAKARYTAIGGRSGAQDEAAGIAESLRRLLGAEAASVTAVSAADPSAAVRLVRSLVAMGGRDLIVSPLGAAVSPRQDAALRAVDALRLSEEGVTVSVAAPLWGSQEIVELITRRTVDAVAPAGRSGAVLVCRGLPPLEDRAYPGFRADQTALANRVRSSLLEHGFGESDVRSAWAEWDEPGVTEGVRHLAALGCRNVLVVPVSDPTESITTRFDLPHAARLAESRVAWKVLPAWGDSPEVAEALAREARRAAGDVLDAGRA